MAYTFLKAQGQEIGKSLLEADKIDLRKKLLAEAKKRNVKFLLPDRSRRRRQSSRPTPSCSRSAKASHSRRHDGARHRAQDDRIVHGGNLHRPHHRLERPHGSLRNRRHSPRALSKIAHAVAENGGAISIIGGGDSVAAVTPPASRTRSPTSPPAAARHWNSWKARNCPGSKP